MAELEKHFPPTTPSAIASFDFTDISEGTGIILLDGFGSVDSTGTLHKLTATTLAGNPNIITGTTEFLAGTFIQALIANFDLTAFNTPKQIQGTVTFEFSVAYEGGVPGGNTIQAKTIIKLQHHDGASNYVDIATATSETVSRTDSTAVIKTYALTATVTPKHFKVGENLRIVVEVLARLSSGGATEEVLTATFPFDPKNADQSPFTATDNHTYFKSHVPFRIDL